MDTTYSTRDQAPNTFTSAFERQTYDSATLKPTTVPSSGTSEGRVEDDVLASEQQLNHNNISQKSQKNLKSILSCVEDSFLGTFNVRAIREDHKRLELVSSFL